MKQFLSGLVGAALMAAVFFFWQMNYATKNLAGQTVFYNPQVVVFECDFLKASSNELKTRFAKREDALNSKINALRADVKKFQSKSKVMSESQREKEAKLLNDRDIALQKERASLEQATLPFKQFVDVEMTKMLRAACAELNQEIGCTAVLDTARNTVMYLAPKADVSQMLRKKVDAKWAKQAKGFVFPK